ncbi:DUF4166 domain-containing protein [Radiobacillus deserti]|nr:DUF4166 domain-containing protein [Radiobacillus deserti]
MSIYRKAMGKDFNRLHPMLQKRYSVSEGSVFVAKGTMYRIRGGPRWLAPLFWLATKRKLLFPEHGQNIPFTIVNQSKKEQVYWKRAFYFPNKTRFFNAVMSLDSKRNVIKDYLGESPVVYSDLVFEVTQDGGILITSKDQRLVIGKWEIPLPKLFQGLARVKESFDPIKNTYRIDVSVRNPMIGHVFAYEGEFIQDEYENSLDW